MNNNVVIGVVIALVVGGLIGYYARGNAGGVYSQDPRDSATMMQENGSTMMQMGQMMMSGGEMMSEKGQQYNDSEMMDMGQQLQENGQMMETQGTTSTEHGSGMMQMMGQ